MEGRGERRVGRGEDRARRRLKKLFFPLPSVLDVGTRQSFYFLFFFSSSFPEKIFLYFVECPRSEHSAKFFFHFFLLFLF